ncbi:hypothetical protein DFH94DRAFT_222183 [Russula ochroleuca]|uniref:Uncharacterized protein n=1 Tax=Russula ochroleuca TaxID=152965 RepID=A0A9P5JYP1_9AGAM|nr:hypothetical protein DFH94DRAFT_222183 [Russula ochroleuca]
MGRHQRVASAMANHLPPCAANLPRPRTPQMGSSPVRAHLQRSPPHLLQESDSLCGQTVTGDYTARFRPQSRNPHQGHRPCGNPWGPALQESHHVIAACTLLEARHQLIHPPTQYLSQSFLARRKADRDWAPTGDNPSAVYLLVIKGALCGKLFKPTSPRVWPRVLSPMMTIDMNDACRPNRGWKNLTYIMLVWLTAFRLAEV